MQQEFNQLLEKLATERDEINLQLHLASMEAKEEFSHADEKWEQIKQKASEIADDSIETSDEVIKLAKIAGDELMEAYQRITKRLNNKD